MSKTKIYVVEIDWSELANFTGNIAIPTIEGLINQCFISEHYVKINDEERIWHESEKESLIKHIQNRKQKGGDE